MTPDIYFLVCQILQDAWSTTELDFGFEPH